MQVVLSADATGSGAGIAEAAALGVAVARRSGEGVLVVEVSDEERRRRPTLLASDAARDLEQAVRAAPGGSRAVARGALCWLKGAAASEEGADPLAAVAELLAHPLPCVLAVVHLPPGLWAEALDRPELGASGGLVRADLGAERELAALAVAELRARGMTPRVAKSAQGPVAARRSLAGLEAGGDATRRAERAARMLAPEAVPGAAGARRARRSRSCSAAPWR